MPITNIDIAAVEPFADGRGFGEAGPYVRIHGVARGELDPAAPHNAGIVDLDKAERNARGMVAYELDLFILRPEDPGRGNGTLVYDVTNRGRKVILGRLDEAPGDANTNDPRTARDAGLGFTLGRGWTLVWSGWDSSAPRAANGMTARLPLALENGQPMVRRIRHEFHIGTRAAGKGESVTLSYPAVSTDTRQARLTVRDRESDARTEIPPGSWEFVDARTIRLLARRHAVRAVQDLRDLVRGGRVAGHRHRLCRGARSGLFPAPRAHRRHRRREPGRRIRHRPRAGFRRIAERPVSAAFSRTRHE